MAIACGTLDIPTAEKLFFSESATKQAKAKALCDICTERASCLQMALDNNIEYGIFGGMTANERKAMKNEIDSCFTDSGTETF